MKVVGNFLEFTLKFLEIPSGNFTHLGGGEILQHYTRVEYGVSIVHKFL